MKTFTGNVLMLLVIAASGCDRKDELVASYRVPKEPPRSSVVVETTNAAPTTMPLGMPGMANANPSMATSPLASSVRAAPTTANEIQWTLPADWKPAPASQMRFAAFQVDPGDPQLFVTIIPLGPEAADLMPNVVRWQGQIGAPPATSIEDVGKVVQHFDLDGTPLDRVDLTSPDTAKSKQRLIAAILSRPDKTWFVKLQGDAAKVPAHVEAFDAFINSLKFPASTATSATSPVASTPIAPTAEPDFVVPAGWTREGPRPMRIATFSTSSDRLNASQVVVMRFANGSIGSPLENINLWRGMLDLKPVDSEAKQPNQSIDIRGTKATVYDLTAEPTAASPAAIGKKMIVLTMPAGDQSWIIRCVGPAADVDAQRAAFESFVKQTKW